MQSNKTRQLVTAAALLALTLVFQNIRLLPIGITVSTYIIGTLVNTCLILAACLVSLWAGLLISIAAPLVALLQGYAPAPMLPFLMAGNVVLVLLYGLIAAPKMKKEGKPHLLSWGIAGVLAAVLKFVVIAVGNALVIPAKEGTAVFHVLLAAGAAKQTQQWITALIAMVLVYLILPRLQKALER
jgi:hypothetical protein